MKSSICGALALSVALTAFPAVAQEIPTRTCEISDGGDLSESARCDIIDVGEVFEFTGIIDENDVTFSVVVNRRTRTARLVGADTFVLADGPATITPDLIAWPNGYSLRLGG